MRIGLWLLLTAVLLCGCTQVDENPEWNPKANYPPWAYDAPFYYRPTEDLEVAEMVEADTGPIPVYYARTEYFFIKHPGGCQVTGEQRIAVWASADQGETWQRAGYYGVEQTHFLLRAEVDGEYWIRFVGPGQGITEVPPGVPHRIYVVDRKAPSIAVTVDPPPYTVDDEGNQIPQTYKVGQTVTLHWTVAEGNLAVKSVRLGTCFAAFPHNLVWSRFPAPLATNDQQEVEIPPEAVGDGGLRFRVEAIDKAGNVGMGLTEVLHIEGEKIAAGGPSRVAATELLKQSEGTPSDRQGWPSRGILWRGGTGRILTWVPKTVTDYKAARLEFSANDGRSWRVVASGLQPNKPVRWRLPTVVSKLCRLRVVGLTEKGEEFMLATSPKFIVDTVMPETEFGPKPIGP